MNSLIEEAKRSAPTNRLVEHEAPGRMIYKRRAPIASTSPSSVVRRERPRRLLVCLDGVPFDIIERARSRGMFDSFNNPSRLLSPFPTMTNVALSTMLRATPPAGYESLYFDRTTRRLAGGMRKYVGPRGAHDHPSDYMDALDYQEPLPCEFLVYAAPERICAADVARFAGRFRDAEPDKDFFAFLKATDGLLHIRGAECLERALVDLDRELRDVRARCGDDTEIMLFSDHGMNLVENHRVPLRKHLEAQGFRLSNELDARDPRQIVVPAFGLCGYVAIYCQDEAVSNEVADALASLRGVDFSVTRDESDARVVSMRGVARIRRRAANGETSYAYQAERGDPLRLHDARSALEREDLNDESGYASGDAWFRATAAHEYPDAPANIYGSISDARVAHTADVLVSLCDGYYYGATLFGHLARRLLATHGNALADSSNAFLMSTHRDFDSHVRASDAYPLLRG